MTKFAMRDGIPDERLSSRYPETHMSQRMVIKAKRKEMDQEDEGVHVLSHWNPFKGMLIARC